MVEFRAALALSAMEPGELVAGRYRLVSFIGRVAMGVLWLARNERLDRQVAVKQLLLDATPAGSPDAQNTEEATARAMREARIAGRLRHPHAIATTRSRAGRPPPPTRPTRHRRPTSRTVRLGSRSSTRGRTATRQR